MTRRPLLAGLILVLGAAGCRLQTAVPMLPTGGNQTPPTTGGGVGSTPDPTVTTPPGAAVPGDNSSLEQLMLERLNRARLRPTAEAARYGIDLNEGLDPGTLGPSVRQPLAFNTVLTGTARAHSRDMLDEDYFGHDNLDGDSPFDRMTDAGYTFRTAGENLAWRGTTGPLDITATVERQHEDLFVDETVPGRGHRITMLNDAYKEVGIGVLRGQFTNEGVTYDSVMSTQDFGTRLADLRYVTGVVYDDRNRNGQYDLGEGRSGASVTVAGIPTTTNSGGGYAVALEDAGTYQVSFSSGGPTTIRVGERNVKVDQIDGSRVQINLGLGPL